MIKWPEPVGGAYVRTFQSARETKTEWIDKVYTEAQLKQAVQDALTLAAARCKALDIGGNSDDYRNGASWCVERIRALIKEKQNETT